MLFSRFKAFVIDMFMINMPILYIAVYVFLGTKEAFQKNQWAIFICVCLYGVIISLFCSIASQTPGMKAQDLVLITKEGDKPSLIRCLFRFLIWIVSLGLIFGFVFPFLRKDHLCFHDFCTKTIVKKSCVRPA